MDEQIISPSDSVVCILTGHELKDPNATVKYHTGIDMKSVQDSAPRETPHGKLSNRPVQVDDDLESIVKALGGDPSLVKGIEMSSSSMSVGDF
jgi:threonine synthase